MRIKLCKIILVFFLLIFTISSFNFFKIEKIKSSNNTDNSNLINATEDVISSTDLEELVNTCNEFIIKINDYLKEKNTSILKIWTNKILKYEKELLNFSLNEKNESEYKELKKRFSNAKDTFNVIKNIVVNGEISYKTENTVVMVDDSLTIASLLSLYAAAVAYFNQKGYVLSEELLEHMRSNDSVNSSYKPENAFVLESTFGYKEICLKSESNETYVFEKDSTIKWNDAYYALHAVNYNKTEDNAAIIISDRYDYDLDVEYDEFITDAMCNAMQLLTIKGYLTPYYVILEYSENFSKLSFKYDSVYMDVFTRYIEKTGILGKWETFRYEFGVYNTGYYTIQTYGPDDTVLRVFDENNIMLVFDDDSGYDTNGLVCHKFESDKKYFISVKMKDFNGVGNIRIGFSPMYASSYNNICKINMSNGKYNNIEVNTTKSYVNSFLFSDNQKKSFTIYTDKLGDTYVDTYLYLIDPRRSNYYDGLLNEEYHPLYIYNDDGGSNRQASLKVNYKEFFSQNVDFILVSSTFNLNVSGSYNLIVDGLDYKKSSGLII